MRPGTALQQEERDDDYIYIYLTRLSLLKIETWEALLLQLMRLLLGVWWAPFLWTRVPLDLSPCYPRVTFSMYLFTIDLADIPRDLLVFSHAHSFFGPRM